MATVTIISDRTHIENNDFAVYFIWDIAVTGFTENDITLSAGTKGTFSGNNGVYRLQITPPTTGSGSIIVTVANNAVSQTNPTATATITYGDISPQPSILPNLIDGVSIACLLYTSPSPRD